MSDIAVFLEDLEYTIACEKAAEANPHCLVCRIYSGNTVMKDECKNPRHK